MSALRRPVRQAAIAAALVALLAVLPSCFAGAGPEDVERPGDSEREVVVVSPPDPDAPRHTHETVIGDGTVPEAGGYEMVDLTFPRALTSPASCRSSSAAPTAPRCSTSPRSRPSCSTSTS